MREYLTGEIAKREAEQRAIKQRAETLTVEILTLREVLSRLDQEEEESRQRASHHLGMEPGLSAASTTQKMDEPRNGKKSRLSPRWAAVVRAAVQRYPQPVRNDEVAQIQRAAGQQPADSNGIRSHVWVSTQAGLYEKLSAGTFRATPTAAVALGLRLGM
jgi:hypothetical protein